MPVPLGYIVVVFVDVHMRVCMCTVCVYIKDLKIRHGYENLLALPDLNMHSSTCSNANRVKYRED